MGIAECKQSWFGVTLAQRYTWNVTFFVIKEATTFEFCIDAIRVKMTISDASVSTSVSERKVGKRCQRAFITRLDYIISVDS